ncbi:MAG: adenosylcobinamide-phosphate synthase CbiB [Thermacetogeniaceae bacterium]
MYLGTLTVLFLAVLLDILIGDPRVAWHPVALIGRLIAAWEGLLYPRTGTPAAQHRDARLVWRGFVLVLGTVLPVWLLVYLCLTWLHRLQLPPGYPRLWAYVYLVVSTLFLWSTVSIRSLGRAAGEILDLLRRGDLIAARRQLGYIVGRDTERLDTAEITRATVETVAENISDGVIAPLFYFLLGGPALACAYRAINTLDSMVGYRNERYRDFGMVAARLDDVANWLPARLTALLLVGSALLLGLDWRRSWRLAWRDGPKHPSPNSGYPEAAVAGALGVQLGGLNYYQGVPSLRARLGDPQQSLEPAHIRVTIRLLYGAAALFLALSAAAWMLWPVMAGR